MLQTDNGLEPTRIQVPVPVHGDRSLRGGEIQPSEIDQADRSRDRSGLAGITAFITEQ